MNTLIQKLLFRQSVVLYPQRNSVFSAIRKFGISRATIYRWRKMYDGTLNSLAERSRRPHSPPNQHTSEELKLISDIRRRNPNDGLVTFRVKLRHRGYSRSITALWRILKRQSLAPVKPPNPKYAAKEYEKMLYTGQRVQADVKEVPAVCIAGDAKIMGEKFYRFTAVDEYSRFRCLAAFKDESSYSASEFIKQLREIFARAFLQKVQPLFRKKNILFSNLQVCLLSVARQF